MPLLLWLCCEQFYNGGQSGCRIAECGPPEEVKDHVDMTKDGYMATVQEYFMRNGNAINKQWQMVTKYRARLSIPKPTMHYQSNAQFYRQ